MSYFKTVNLNSTAAAVYRANEERKKQEQKEQERLEHCPQTISWSDDYYFWQKQEEEDSLKLFEEGTEEEDTDSEGDQAEE
mgnify:CR=1 FL=1